MRRIYRTYNDTEVVEIAVRVECPNCGSEWLEDATECGKTYVLSCGDDFDDGCGEKFEMHFDAS